MKGIPQTLAPDCICSSLFLPPIQSPGLFIALAACGVPGARHASGENIWLPPGQMLAGGHALPAQLALTCLLLLYLCSGQLSVRHTQEVDLKDGRTYGSFTVSIG